jgi:hypothetical protein
MTFYDQWGLYRKNKKYPTKHVLVDKNFLKHMIIKSKEVQQSKYIQIQLLRKNRNFVVF